MTDRRYRLLPDAVRLRPELSVPAREGARFADEIYERSKDTLGRLFRREIEMTDQRYTGPDGAKRLEMLEMLAVYVRLDGPIHGRHSAETRAALDAIVQDNRRVDHLEKKETL